MKRTTKKAINQKGGFLGNVIGPSLKKGLPLMKNILAPLATGLHVIRINCSNLSNRCSYSNEKMKGIMEIVKYLEKSGLLNKVVNKTIEDEVKEQKGGFIGMLAATLDASLLGNMLPGKGAMRADKESYPSWRRNN